MLELSSTSSCRGRRVGGESCVEGRFSGRSFQVWVTSVSTGVFGDQIEKFSVYRSTVVSLFR